MRRYETIYILRPSLNEEEINTIVENSIGIITEDGGQVIELDRWGMRKLAYQINKEVQGFYVLCDYAGTPQAVAEMERKFRIDDSVLRYMTLKTAESITVEEIAEATSQVAAKNAVSEEVEEITEATSQVATKKADSEKVEEIAEATSKVAAKNADSEKVEEITEATSKVAAKNAVSEDVEKPPEETQVEEKKETTSSSSDEK